MKTGTISAILIFSTLPVFPQQSGPQNREGRRAPIYHVTVTERTVKAINYQYRSGPTKIDFRGTVLLPLAKGDAVVESKAGRAEINAHFENLAEPARFGGEYLTYVLWALTPDGRPHNLGEVVANSSDKSRIRVTTDFQAFALIVTAEPYSAVRQPSDVVVMENAVRPDTVGKIEQVDAHYELLPRGEYAWQVPADLESGANHAHKVSMSKYEEMLEVYQAQNALGIARAANAERYAPNTFAKAQQLLREAQQIQSSKGDHKRVIQIAREAAETAEDSRLISEQHARDEKTAQETAASQQALARAQAEALQAREEANAAREQAAAARAAQQQAEAQAAASRAAQKQAETQLYSNSRANPPSPSVQQQRAPAPASTKRMQLLERLNGPLATRDTPRGLIATVPDSGFTGVALRSPAADRVARIAAILAAQPGLRIQVEGHSDGADRDVLSAKRAEAVRRVLVAHGLPGSAVTARGLAGSRPLGSNATTAGRQQNQRVEIVVSGDLIGSTPFWDRTYALN